MDRRTSIAVGHDGAPLVRHTAGPGAPAEVLRREAQILELARGPGVVHLVEVADTPDGGATLATRYVAGGNLTHLVRTDGEPAALAALASVARTLARLHDLGIVHGACSADHVVGDAGGVALCGFGHARAADPGAATSDAAPDLEAFAALVGTTLASDGEVAGRARQAAARLTGDGTGGGTDLRAVAAELAALAALHHRATAPRGLRTNRMVAPRGTEPAGPSRWRPGRLAAALGVVVVAATAVAWPAGDHTSDRAAPHRVVADGEPTTVRPAPPRGPTAGGHAGRPATTVPAPVSAPLVDHDGDQYAVGQAGDLVVVGDWDCDGTGTPAVVRPGDGSVWTFSRWADGAGAVAAVPLGHAPTPVRAEAVRGADGCDLVAVTTAGGERVVLGG